jgi:hypothetical protein
MPFGIAAGWDLLLICNNNSEQKIPRMIRQVTAACLVATSVLVQPVLMQPVLAQPALPQQGQRASTLPMVPIVVGAVAGAAFSFLVWPIVATIGTLSVGGGATGAAYVPFMVGGTMMGGSIGFIVSR